MVVSPKRILWPTDFSQLALQGARYARGFREVFQAALHVIHVIPPPLPTDLAVTLPIEAPIAFTDPEVEQSCRERLAALVAEQFGDLPDVHCEVLFGNPWSVICKYAQQTDVDLIVVSTHGRTGIRRVLIGSTAERIVEHAPCPVLVVKADAKDFVRE